jgi:AcrR family transcriptional regulator
MATDKPIKPKPVDMERKKSRGRPRVSEEQAAAMRFKIRAQAHRLFQQEGYGSVSMRRLAREVGCTPMTLYNYFENKIDILRDVWAQVFDELFDEIEKTKVVATCPKDAVLQMAHIYTLYWLNHVDHYRMVFMTEGVSQPDVSIFVGEERVLSRFGMLYQALDLALGNKTEPATLKLKVDLLICTLNGIAHSMITISAYPWSEASKMVDAAVKGIVESSA